jgi:hypothetical protein
MHSLVGAFIAGVVLTAPGYVLAAALFPTRHLDPFERAALGVGLSIAAAVGGGLLLDRCGIALTQRSWAVFLAAVTLGAAAVAWRRRKAAGRDAEAASLRGLVRAIPIRQIVLGLLAVILLTGALAISRVGAERQPHPGFTQLWAVPAPDPRHPASVPVQVGVRSAEKAAGAYVAEVVDGPRLIGQWSLYLEPGQTWTRDLQVDHGGQVEVKLYRGDVQGQPYRRVDLPAL